MKTLIVAGVVSVAAFLWLVGNAVAATPAQVASWAAGKPVTVQVDQSGLYGWASPSTSTIHVAPFLLAGLNDPAVFTTGRTRFVRAGMTESAHHWDAIALHTVLHESVHVRFPSAPEGAVDLAAYLLFPAALERFYGMPVGSPAAARLWWYHGYTFDAAWFAR